MSLEDQFLQLPSHTRKTCDEVARMVEACTDEHILMAMPVHGRWYCKTCCSGWVEVSALLKGEVTAARGHVAPMPYGRA